LQFLKNKGKGKLDVVNESDVNLIKMTEMALTVGRWIVVKSNCVEFDSRLNPIIEK
jgi:hypothetical protein